MQESNYNDRQSFNNYIASEVISSTNVEVDKMIEELNALQMYNSDPFLQFIAELNADFDTRYTTVYSLQEIPVRICELPRDVQAKNHKWIKTITDSIKSYGVAHKPLTHWQRTKLLREINGIHTPAGKSRSNIEIGYDKLRYGASGTGEVTLNDMEYVNRAIASHDVISIPTKKYTSDDEITSAVLNLLENMSRNVLSSSLNNFVLDYIEVAATIRESLPGAYTDVMKDVDDCLKKHSWRISGGFQSEPNRLKIIEDLHTIINRYL